MLEQPSPQGVEKYLGKPVLSSDGEKLGNVGRFLPNRITGVPQWMIAESGLLVTRSLVVPIAGSSFEDGEVRIAYPAQVVAEAPEIESDDELAPEAEAILVSYFGLGAG